ncbi:MAG TPA: hypothetical protein VER76_09475 [Pyrinomonadaceae bacterium]|nr:hypothetical protein [Pyrinomonadaceae bacterium]
MKKMLSVIAFVLMITVVVLPVCQPVDSSAMSFASAADAATDLSNRDDAGGGSRLASADEHAYTQFGATSLGFNFMQSRVSPACANWRRRFNYASSRAVQAAASGTLQEMYYWNNQLERLNAEQQRKRTCPYTGGGGGGSSSSALCDRANYESCMRDARGMTSPTTGGQTSTGIMMQSQCRQWIAGCR